MITEVNLTFSCAHALPTKATFFRKHPIKKFATVELKIPQKYFGTGN